MTGAQFEIRIDGTSRTYRDRKDDVMKAARLKQESAQIGVKDLQIGDVTAVALSRGKPMHRRDPAELNLGGDARRWQRIFVGSTLAS
jgi:hypothetical protein